MPISLWGGNTQHGYTILNGFFIIHDENNILFQKSWTTPQELFSDTDYFMSYLCRFEWLKDLKATGDMSARRLARRLIEYWIQNKLYKKTIRKIRKNEEFILSTRISTWILLYDFFGASANDFFKKIFFRNLQTEYRILRRKLLNRCNLLTKLSMLKAVIEYNVYCEHDAAFFHLLLKEIIHQSKHLETQITSKNSSMYNIFREFCVIIDIRNALLQWEKSFLKNYPYYRKSYQKSFKEVQLCLQKIMQFIRFYRHSNGHLSHLDTGNSSCFYESILSTNIDTALSQVDPMPSFIIQENQRKDIIRQATKRSTLFINLLKKDFFSYKIDNYQNNLMPKVMNFEWSVQSYNIVQSNSVSLFQKGITSFFYKKENKSKEDILEKYSQEAQSHDISFSGIISSEENKYFFKRTLKLSTKEDLLIGEDHFTVAQEMQDPIAILQFFLGAEWNLSEITHEQESLRGEIIYQLKSPKMVGKTKNKRHRQRILCILKIETKHPFHIKTSKKDDFPVVTFIFMLEPGTLENIQWSFQILKA